MSIAGDLLTDLAIDELIEFGRALSRKGLDDYGRTGGNQAAGLGRNTGADTLPTPARIYASELLDRNTCPACYGVDGKEYATVEDSLEDYPAGGYVDCDGGPRCRGTRVFVWEEEAPPTIGAPPPEFPTQPPPPPPPRKPEGGAGPTTVDLESPDPVTGKARAEWAKAIDRRNLEETLGRELRGGEVLRVTGARAHGRILGDVEARVGKDRRIIAVGDDVVEGRATATGRAAEDIREELFDELNGYIDTIPPEFADSVSQVIASEASFSWSTAAATSDGPTIAFWHAASKPSNISREIFDHELGHSIRHTINDRLSGLVNSLDPRYVTPGGSFTAEGLELTELLGSASHPGAAWQKAASGDLRLGTRLRKAADGIEADATKAALKVEDIWVKAGFDLDDPNIPGIIDVRDVILGRSAGLPGPAGEMLDADAILKLAGKRTTVARQLVKDAASRRTFVEVGGSGNHRVQPFARGEWKEPTRAVTDYAAKNDAEDWAESIRLWLRDRRVGGLGRNDAGATVGFRDLYPERAAYLDRIGEVLGFTWWS